MPDGTFRFHSGDNELGAMCMIGTFSQWGTISETSCVKVDDDLPLEIAVLVGCGVPTGWGSAVYAAEVTPGDTVAIYGIGGIGINAVQGAKHAGAMHVIAVDPVEFKRETAQQLGATHAFKTMDEAAEFARSVTDGQGADAAIVTTGVLKTEHVRQAFDAIRKAGTVVVTGIGSSEEEVRVPAFELTLYQKRIQGALFGASSPSRDIPWMLRMYQSGQLALDELITTTYKLDDINQGYADMHAGKNIRGVIVY